MSKMVVFQATVLGVVCYISSRMLFLSLILLCVFFFKIFKFLLLYERHTERGRDRAEAGEQQERGKAGSLLNREPHTGLDPRTLGS